MNYLLIAVNIGVFLTVAWNTGGRRGYSPYLLHPSAPSLVQFITYQFHHAGLSHLLMNMVFLYVFGNNVEDRLGKAGYLLFYLAGGILAGLGHSMLEPAPVLGASGAVAGVVGCYLAWFPVSNITMMYWVFMLVGTFEISSMMLILFQAGQDAVMFLGQFGGVAYLAHLSGYAYGFGIGMGLLWLGVMPREPYDFLALIQQYQRRRQFQALTRDGYQPWLHGVGPHGRGGVGESENTASKEIMDLRVQIHEAVGAHEIQRAAQLYTQLLAIDPRQVMSQQQQLDLANQLMAQQRYEWAAKAYELFLSAYKGYGQHGKIELILGLIYGRYLGQYARARELLERAKPYLMEPGDRELAGEVLAEIAGLE